MSVVLAVDLFAVLFFAVGFLLAFKPSVLRGAWRRGGGVSEEVASALRIGGVMVMAFSVTICVFANLIAYSAAGAR